MKTQAFDQAALSYDNDFTNSSIGRTQREQVWSYLEKYLTNDRALSILEVNCGSGEDAIRLAKAGHKVLATDISEEMISIANSKINSDSGQLRFEQMDLRDINKLNESYDLVFSNFGGLNCLNTKELSDLLNNIPNLLKQRGRFIGVFMSRFCLVESLYFILSFRWKKTFRRLNKNGTTANSIDSNLKVYYFSPRTVRKVSKELKFKSLKGIGILVPPSYLESKFSKQRSLLRLLNSLDRFLARFPGSAYFSDHYLIDFEAKS